MPQTLSLEEFKELGKRYYGRKDYERALGAFTNGIDASIGRDIQLYDYRAAVYDKLERYSEALSDARHMIRAFEADPRGYLRAGQILLKMDKKPQALQVYARGLKYVSSTNTQINLLRGAHDKLNRELCPPKAVDPFTQMPQEIVEMIMSYLKFYELVSCLRVSKQWKLFLESLPNLWRNVDIMKAGPRRSVKPSFLKTVAKMAQGKVKEARIANYGHKGYLMSFITACQALEKLEFMQTSLGTQTMLEAVVPARSLKCLIIHGDTEVHGDTITAILKNRPTLEELRVHNVGLGNTPNKSVNFPLPQLKILDLRNVHFSFIYANHFMSILAQATNLRTIIFEENYQNVVRGQPLRLPWFSDIQHLEYLRLKVMVFAGLPVAPQTSLRTLDFEAPASYVTHDVPHRYPYLEHLRLKAAQFVDVQEVLHHGDGSGAMREEPSKLKSFSWCSSTPPDSLTVREILEDERLREIEELDLSGIVTESLKDRDVPLLVAMKRLRRLSLHSACITGLGLKDLVNGLKGVLKHVTLTACDKVGHDAAEWAARQGVDMIVHESGGKVVRRMARPA